LHTALVLFGCISPDMCIAYTLALSSFDSLFIQGCIHDDHEDLINKHIMMIRVTDNI
jgi:hypothetical protein